MGIGELDGDDNDVGPSLLMSLGDKDGCELMLGLFVGMSPLPNGGIVRSRVGKRVLSVLDGDVDDVGSRSPPLLGDKDGCKLMLGLFVGMSPLPKGGMVREIVGNRVAVFSGEIDRDIVGIDVGIGSLVGVPSSFFVFVGSSVARFVGDETGEFCGGCVGDGDGSCVSHLVGLRDFVDLAPFPLPPFECS